eukprot:XP_014000168.1 PREDICTED: general transcription factor 3C polypeptide 2-like [Salmo salar]
MESVAEKYLSQEMVSTAFTVFRESTPLHRLKRFECLPAHPERWDMLFYMGVPVWATPFSQYAAIYFLLNYSLSPSASTIFLVFLSLFSGLFPPHLSASIPILSPVHSNVGLGIAQDKGFVWNVKWCPGGAWELLTTNRKTPHMPRLRLLAASTSEGHITIYSLPQPNTLLACRKHTAQRDLMVMVGDDRRVTMWDLRTTWEP